MKAADKYHYCATCEHYRVVKREQAGTKYVCSRLGYDTQPKYIFNCWSPNAAVRRLIEK